MAQVIMSEPPIVLGKQPYCTTCNKPLFPFNDHYVCPCCGECYWWSVKAATADDQRNVGFLNSGFRHAETTDYNYLRIEHHSCRVGSTVDDGTSVLVFGPDGTKRRRRKNPRERQLDRDEKRGQMPLDF